MNKKHLIRVFRLIKLLAFSPTHTSCEVKVKKKKLVLLRIKTFSLNFQSALVLVCY